MEMAQPNGKGRVFDRLCFFRFGPWFGFFSELVIWFGSSVAMEERCATDNLNKKRGGRS
jgi:hypothetical protein